MIGIEKREIGKAFLSPFLDTMLMLKYIILTASMAEIAVEMLIYAVYY
jgi:hypothetical protein